MNTLLDTILLEQRPEVAENMERFGGSFMQNLGRALRHADIENVRKIYQTWTDEWIVYHGFSKTLNKVGAKCIKN